MKFVRQKGHTENQWRTTFGLLAAYYMLTIDMPNIGETYKELHDRSLKILEIQQKEKDEDEKSNIWRVNSISCY